MKTRGVWVWVVEMLNGVNGATWEPTVGVGLTREQAYATIKDWRRRNPSDKFRLKRYVPGRATR